MRLWWHIREQLGLNQVRFEINRLLTQGEIMATVLEDLQREVTETKTAVRMALDGIVDLRVKLADAIAAADQAALTALTVELDQLQADITAVVSPPPVA